MNVIEMKLWQNGKKNKQTETLIDISSLVRRMFGLASPQFTFILKVLVDYHVRCHLAALCQQHQFRSIYILVPILCAIISL